MSNEEHGQQAEAYLQSLSDTKKDAEIPRGRREPEAKVKEIFDRLDKSGKEHRVRRRVYHELGRLVEQAREAQQCTFEPTTRQRPAHASVADGPGCTATERLYREGLERKMRREQAILNAPVPPFRPQKRSSVGGVGAGAGRSVPLRGSLIDGRQSKATAEGGQASPRDTLAAEEAHHHEQDGDDNREGYSTEGDGSFLAAMEDRPQLDGSDGDAMRELIDSPHGDIGHEW